VQSREHRCLPLDCRPGLIYPKGEHGMVEVTRGHCYDDGMKL